jgi:transcriptional regulator with XRE-family HTH domain
MSIYAKRAVKNLRKMIVDSSLPSAKVATGAGIHEATISKYLSGQREPKISVLEKIAEYLKRDFQDFFR